LEKSCFGTKSLSLNFALAPTDDGASEIEQGQIVRSFLLPADEQAAKAIDPGVSDFYNPTSRLAASGLALAFFFALALSGTWTV
jgi:hypothetical protein